MCPHENFMGAHENFMGAHVNFMGTHGGSWVPMGRIGVPMGRTGVPMRKTGVPMGTPGIFGGQITICPCGTFLTGVKFSSQVFFIFYLGICVFKKPSQTNPTQNFIVRTNLRNPFLDRLKM